MKRLAVLALLLLSTLFSSIQVNASSTGIIGPDVIHKEQNKILTTADILSLYSSTIGIIQVAEDNYTGFGNVLGSHSMMLFATDGNEQATKNVEIIVLPELGDVLAVTNYKDILVRTSQILTPQDIVLTLENTGYIEITATTQMMMVTNTYSENAEIPGQYFFEFRLVNAAGVNAVYSSIITVSEEDDPFIPDIIFTPPASPLQTLWNILQFALIGGIVFLLAKGYLKLKKKLTPKKRVNL